MAGGGGAGERAAGGTASKAVYSSYPFYEVRSQALHGRDIAAKLAEAEAMVTSLYRLLFFLSYQTCCHLACLASEKMSPGTGLVGPMKTLGAVTAASFARLKNRLHLDWLET